MAKEFKYQDPFPMGKDKTEYYLLTKEHVSVSQFEGQEILKVEPEALTKLARAAMHDCSFLLRPEHQKQTQRLDRLCAHGQDHKAADPKVPESHLQFRTR